MIVSYFDINYKFEMYLVCMLETLYIIFFYNYKLLYKLNIFTCLILFVNIWQHELLLLKRFKLQLK